VKAAAAFAKASEIAIAFVNEPTTEGRDLPSLNLSGAQNDLVSAVAAANPRTIVVLETGGPAAMPWTFSVGAAIEIWYPGLRGAEALANILFGDVNPQAKLPATFPRSDADLPHPAIFGSDQRPTPHATPPPGGVTAPPQRFQMKPFDIDYTEGLKVGYKWFQAENKKPLFAFGHGLSYTSFAYSDVTATIDSVSFTVRNTGRRAGAEIAQVYASLPASANEPPKRHFGFGLGFGVDGLRAARPAPTANRDVRCSLPHGIMPRGLRDRPQKGRGESQEAPSELRRGSLGFWRPIGAHVRGSRPFDR
jgi:beta-glucosidase